MKRPAEARRAILLGRGVDEVYEGKQIVGYTIGEGSRQRALAMVGYYNQHKKLFASQGALIVPSGGWAEVGHGQQKPPEKYREGNMMADLMVREGVPHRIIWPEIWSGSTTQNIEKTIWLGAFGDKDDHYEFTADDPLLMVASRAHGKYRGVPLACAGFGIEDPDGIRLLVAESDSPKDYLREMGGGVATVRAIADVDPKPFVAEDMARVGDRFHEIISNPLLLAKAGLAQAIEMAA